MVSRAALLSALLLLTALWPGRAARAEDIPLLCRRDEVVDLVARRLRERNVYASLDRTRITETGDGTANAVTCHADVAVVGYALTQAGFQPRTVIQRWSYAVRVFGHRFEVRLLD